MKFRIALRLTEFLLEVALLVLLILWNVHLQARLERLECIHPVKGTLCFESREKEAQ